MLACLRGCGSGSTRKSVLRGRTRADASDSSDSCRKPVPAFFHLLNCEKIGHRTSGDRCTGCFFGSGSPKTIRASIKKMTTASTLIKSRPSVSKNKRLTTTLSQSSLVAGLYQIRSEILTRRKFCLCSASSTKKTSRDDIHKALQIRQLPFAQHWSCVADRKVAIVPPTETASLLRGSQEQG